MIIPQYWYHSADKFWNYQPICRCKMANVNKDRNKTFRYTTTKILHYHITDIIRHLSELYVLYRSPYKLLLNIAHSTIVQCNAELHLSNCHSKIKDCKAEESCTLPTICLTRSLEGKIQFSIWGKLHTKSGIQQSFLFKKIIAFILFCATFGAD